METVKVLNVRKLESAGNLKGFIDVQIGPILVRGFSVFETKNGLIVSVPRRLGRDGQWADALDIQDEALAEAVKSAILEAYNEADVTEGA